MNDDINKMELTRAYKFRIYPDATRQAEINERLVLAQQFYNKILEKSIESYKNEKAKVSMAQFNRFVKEIIQEDKKYPKLYSQTRCEIEYGLLKAYQNFFRGIKEGGKKAGFPRFRPRDRYKSITYPQGNAWNRFIQMLSYKAESAGMKVIKVDARNTSKECGSRGNIQETPLSERICICNRCGMQMDRDMNASINMLNRTTIGQRGSHAQGDMASAVQQASKSRIEELGTDKTRPLRAAAIA